MVGAEKSATRAEVGAGHDKPASQDAAALSPVGAPTAPAAPSAPAAPTVTSVTSAVRSGFVDCLLRCDEAKMGHAEKATCRYNCEGVAPGVPAGVGDPGASDTDPVGSVVRCLGGCSGKAGTCVTACKDAVHTSLTAPSRAVLDELGTCVVACHTGKHPTETNVSTCELNCAEAARVAGPGQP